LATAREVLDLAVKANPEYTWKLCDSAVYFYSRSIADDPNYFLNWRVRRFHIPGTVADADLRLRSELAKLQHHIQREGGLIVGLRSNELAEHTLPELTLRDRTVAEIMCQLLSLDRGFYSVVLFPQAGRIRDADLEAAFLSWRWVPFKKAGVAP
jgi:hypothetical protein